MDPAIHKYNINEWLTLIVTWYCNTATKWNESETSNTILYHDDIIIMQTTLHSCCWLKTSRSQCSVSQQQRERASVGARPGCWLLCWVLGPGSWRWWYHTTAGPHHHHHHHQLSSSGFCSQSSLETISWPQWWAAVVPWPPATQLRPANLISQSHWS